MSVRVMADVWSATGIEPRLKFILLAFADNADEDTRLAWPSKKTIADKTGYSERNVQRIIGELKDAGLLEPAGDRSYANGRIRVPVYRVHTPTGDRMSPLGETDRPSTGDRMSGTGDDAVPQSVKNRQRTVTRAESSIDKVERLVDDWLATTHIVSTRAVRKQLSSQARDYVDAGGPVDGEFLRYAVDAGCHTISGLAYFAADYRKPKTLTYPPEVTEAARRTAEAIRSGQL